MGSPSVTCYPQPGKLKSLRLCEAFARGAGGQVAEVDVLQPGPAAFYGVVGLEALYRRARLREGTDWYYADNAYFDGARGHRFRVEKNGLQAFGGEPAWRRWEALGLPIWPWRRDGRHVVVAMQSDHFMREVACWPHGAAGWLEFVLGHLRAATDRLIVVRHWSRDKAEQARTLRQDLDGAWALVTHMSAAANEAVLAGVPVFVTGPCAAAAMGSADIAGIESPRYPEDRARWAAALAGRQWTLEELEEGRAWRTLNP